MNLLLDTHTLLWWLDHESRLPADARQKIDDEANIIFVSTASIWEISIKKALGKLDSPDDLLTIMAENNIRVLPIDARHAYAVRSLPRLHGDPFDRMLVVQAMIEDLTLMTHDRALSHYAIPCFMV